MSPDIYYWSIKLQKSRISTDSAAPKGKCVAYTWSLKAAATECSASSPTDKKTTVTERYTHWCRITFMLP